METNIKLKTGLGGLQKKNDCEEAGVNLRGEERGMDWVASHLLFGEK